MLTIGWFITLARRNDSTSAARTCATLNPAAWIGSIIGKLR